MTQEATRNPLDKPRHDDDWVTQGHGGYHRGVVNAIARALTRLELVHEWAGADHDMPGTTQQERELSRWAAVQFLDELQKELLEPSQHTQMDPPAVTTSTGLAHGTLTAGPFKSLRDTTPQDEQDNYWGKTGKPRLISTSDKRADELRTEIYDTPLWEPNVMTTQELEAELFDRFGSDDEMGA